MIYNKNFSIPSLILSHIGMTYSRVGTTYSRIGMTYSRVGTTYSRVGMTYSRVGMTYSHVGTTYSRVGMTYSRVGTTIIFVKKPSTGNKTTPFIVRIPLLAKIYTLYYSIKTKFNDAFQAEREFTKSQISIN